MANNNDEFFRESMGRNSDGAASPELAPISVWTDARDLDHFVQFYETDQFLVESIGGFIGSGLGAGEAGIVVATKEHREGVEEHLRAYGVDVAAARSRGQYVELDAAETLAGFMTDGSPEPLRFAEVVQGVIRRAAETHSRVRVFGELVTLLWAEGNYKAAIRVEELWNDLRKTDSFSLFCAYPMNRLSGAALGEPLSSVCREHSRVIPAESYTALTNSDQRLRAIIELQQKARSLEIEVAERREAEAAVRAVKSELEVQVEDLRRLHEMSTRLTSLLDFESVLREVLRAALAVHGTEMGLLSLSDPGRAGLSVKVQSGFDERSLREIGWIPGGGRMCRACFEQCGRVVIEDVMAESALDINLEVARLLGFRACHSTPLITHAGRIIGVISVHFRDARRPSEREIRLMDLYARMAADSIDNAQLHHQTELELEKRREALVGEQVARAEAESANRMKDEFLATVSHELRTPLNAIIGWSHMLRGGSLDEANRARAIETIERNAKSQAQLIEDILDVSRMITGKLRLNIRSVDVSSAINSAVDSVQLAADSKNIRLEVTVDPSVRHIYGDSSRLQQIIWNLISNAIKFTPAGGRVDIRLERVDQEAQIKVTDTGQGISQSVLPYIFDRFRQGDGTITRRHGGLGLGLAIVRHLVELHGGTISAESPGEGGGATFTVRLPFTAANESPKSARRITGSLSPIEPFDTNLPLPLLTGVKVLLVDDDQDTLQMLTTILTNRQALVHSAASAAEAFQALQWFHPDVLVSDLAMPGEDGYSVIAKMRALQGNNRRPTPAVALTAYVRIEDRARALSAGFNMFVPKPVAPHELVTVIANLAEPVAIGTGK